jgi:hypothetical protein
MALETVTAKNGGLQQISIHPPYMFVAHDIVEPREIDRDDLYRQWSALDRLLLELSELHSIRVRIACNQFQGWLVKLEDWVWGHVARDCEGRGR